MIDLLQQLITLLQQSAPLFFLSVALFSLLIGSFLNVVIHRLPIMMTRDWKAQCQALLADEAAIASPDKPDKPAEPFNLSVPRSRCPACGHPITAMENIPILSYVWLKGRCSNCKTHISPRYPIIEFVTMLLSVIVAWKFGVSWQMPLALVLTWALICLTMIDVDEMLLPDDITLPLLWLGILLGYFGVFVDLESSVIGAMAGYLSLWGVYQLFKLTTGKEGMGYGDFKLLAVFGAWLGWQPLLLIIILSSCVGAVVGISLVLMLGRDKNIPIPFGPYLAAAGWITLIGGDAILNAYLRWSGLA